ncbi:MAG: hypothetical protein LC708_02940, partial [Actinobacteria bacterium]|nr:hypothetical protein [Actinomycetota bacterium]
MVLPSGILVGPGSTASFPVLLTGAAPTSPVVVNLSTVSSAVATVTTSVTIAAGSTSTSATITGVAAGQTTLTASATGYVATSTVATAKTVTMSFDPAGSFNVYATQANTRRILLSDAAPTGGVVVAIAIADPTKASLSVSSVVVAAGQLQSPSFDIGWIAPGTTTLTATATGITTQSVTLYVAAAPSISASCYYCYPLGAGLTSSPYNYYFDLSNPAPAGGQVVTISSSNTAIAVPTASVTVPAGQTRGYFGADGIAVGGPVSFSLAASGWTSGTVSAVSVVAPEIRMYSFSTSRTTFSGADPIRAQLTCSSGQSCGTARSAVTLSYAITSPSVAGIATLSTATSTIAIGQSVSDNLGTVATPTAAGTYKITPSASGFTSIESSAVTVALPSISASCYYCYPLGAGLTSSPYNYYFDLSNPAPAGGQVVTISSSNTAIAVPTASVTVPAGQTRGYFGADG